MTNHTDREVAQADYERLKAAVASLSPYFDTVQLFVTRNEAASDHTVAAHIGTGNWFARLGHIRQWITEHAPIHTITKADPDQFQLDDDEDDE